jgi:20S proteasome alpha/beta subunit
MINQKVFEAILKEKISKITFSGHRVNDEYSLGKRRIIIVLAISAFEEAAQRDAQSNQPKAVAQIKVDGEMVEVFDDGGPRVVGGG